MLWGDHSPVFVQSLPQNCDLCVEADIFKLPQISTVKQESLKFDVHYKIKLTFELFNY